MRIGILEAGENRTELEARHGSFSAMFQRLLGFHDPGLTFETYLVFKGLFPPSLDRCDAWLVTGSRHTAFERLDWMIRLESFLQEAMAKGQAIAGICFGHQILAQAMGGAVEQAPAGWGLGLHCYRLTLTPESTPAWLTEKPETLCLSAVHRDQVTRLPPNARILASSPFCPAAILAYGDQAITFQAHPEFCLPFLKDLLSCLAQDGIEDSVLKKAFDSVRAPQAHTDSALAARWILALFTARHRKGSPL